MLGRMCTIIAAVQMWPGRPLVIAANRDEALNRPATEPRVWAAGEVADRRVLAPRDVRGGTWLGVNDAGLFVGITNRRAHTDSDRRSRGELVLEALGAEHHEAARARITKLSARDYNPFPLLLADRHGASVVWSDGERLHELELARGIHWITERSFGPALSGRHELLTRHAERLAAGPAPDLEGWRSILADHGPHGRPGPLAIRVDSVCVHARPVNYGTRSSTVLELGDGRDELRFFHAAGRPCDRPLVELGADAARLLAAPDSANSA
jgi:uncharacterized protein with NRDE domain